MSNKTSARQKQCLAFQEKMANRRERDFWHEQKWNNQVQYYRKWEKANTKFYEWTSPRYYESNYELIDRARKDKEKAESLEKRRAKLKSLFSEEEATHEIEIIMKKAEKEGARYETRFEDIPTELLKDVNVGLKLEEDEKKRREAELQLYHQWRDNNPMIKDAERRRDSKNVKLSWLDQQIERRMAKEKEKAECKKILRERDKNIEEQKRREQIMSEELQRRNKELQQFLVKQMEKIDLKQKLSEGLQEEEREEFEKQRKITDLEEKLKLEEAKRKSRECALFNLKQYKMKLRRMAKDIEENIQKENDFVTQILNSQAVERIRDAIKRDEVKKTLDEFLEYTKAQKVLEKGRREYLDFVFDSEAKLTYEKQKELWDREAQARQSLIKDVLDTINEQIKENIRKNKDEQEVLTKEREEMLEDVDRYERELEENKRLEEVKRKTWKKELDEQVADKKTRERRLKDLEKRKVDVDLENIRKEEERLKREIMKIQNSHAPLRYARKKPWY